MTSITGRPPTPLAVRRAEGNRSKLAKSQFEAEVSPATEAQRGRPPMPAALKGEVSVDELERQLDTLRMEDASKDEVERIEKSIKAERNLQVARTHWNYLVKELANNGLLATLDQGVLTGLCLNFAGQFEAARAGEWRTFAELQAKYTAAADRCGLNESARARLPRKPVEKVDPLEAALSGPISQPRTQ